LEERCVPAWARGWAAGVLTITGNPSGNAGSLAVVGVNTVVKELGAGGSTWTMPDAFAPFLNSIVFQLGGANNTLYLRSTLVPTQVDGGALNQIKVGDTSNRVQGIQAPLTIRNAPAFNVVTVNDKGDTVFRPNATIDVVLIGAESFERVSGLGAAPILVKWGDTRSLTVRTGTGGATVGVLATYPFFGGTTLSGNGTNTDTVNVGNAGQTAGIWGQLTVENEADYTAIDVNDSNDAAYQNNVALDVVAGYGQVTGLSPGTIRYDCADTRSLAVRTGRMGATVNVLATFAFAGGGGTTVWCGGGGGTDSVYVGNAGLTAGIWGPLTIEYGSSVTPLIVDDSADGVFRNVTHKVVGSYGRITGLSPGLISYSCFAVSNLTVATGFGGAAVTVENTCVPTTLAGSGAGTDTVWVQGTTPWGPLTVNVGFMENVYLCDPGHTLGSILSPVQVNGDGTTVLYVIDQDNPGPETYTYNNTNLSTTAGSIVNFNGITTLWLYPSANIAGTTFVNNTVFPPWVLMLSYGVPPC
jgi:hypothetical protein